MPPRYAVKEPPETSQRHAKYTSPTLQRPYPTTVSHQQFRPQVGSHNTPYTAKHSIQTRHRDRQSTNSQKPLNTTQKQAAILYCDPTQLLFQINNAEQRGRVTQHTIQPHVASKSANARPRHAVQAPPETSQHHAKHKAYSSATLPIYCFHSPRTGISCDPTPIAFCCACHAIVLPYMLQDQLRPYPPHRGRVTTDPEEVGSQPTPLPCPGCPVVPSGQPFFEWSACLYTSNASSIQGSNHFQ